MSKGKFKKICLKVENNPFWITTNLWFCDENAPCLLWKWDLCFYALNLKGANSRKCAWKQPFLNTQLNLGFVTKIPLLYFGGEFVYLCPQKVFIKRKIKKICLKTTLLENLWFYDENDPCSLWKWDLCFYASKHPLYQKLSSIMSSFKNMSIFNFVPKMPLIKTPTHFCKC